MANDKTTTSSKGVLALTLDTTRGTICPTVFPGVLNAVFEPGQPVTLSSLGITERAAKLLISDGLPLLLTRVGDDAKED